MNNIAGKTFLVTGCAGFIGSHLCDKLIAHDAKVLGWDNCITGKIENVNLRVDFWQKDIADLQSFNLCNKISGIFHMAAIPRVPTSFIDPELTNASNLSNTLHLFEIAKKSLIKNIIFSSSSSVYGFRKDLAKQKKAMTEDLCLYPASPYALQKMVCEKYAELYNKHSKMNIVSLRYFNVYGPRQDDASEYSGVIAKFRKIFKNRVNESELPIYGDGKQSRDFTYVDYVAMVNIALMDKMIGGVKIPPVMNAGGGRSYSINELASVFEEITGNSIKKTYLSKRLGDIEFSKADISLLKLVLDEKYLKIYNLPLKEGLKFYLDYGD